MRPGLKELSSLSKESIKPLWLLYGVIIIVIIFVVVVIFFPLHLSTQQ